MYFDGIDSDNERFFRAMLQLSSSPIIITDARAPDNPMVLVNPAFEVITGYRADEVIGQNCRMFQNDDRDQPGRVAFANAILAGRPCEVTLRNYRKDGEMFWARIHMFPVTDTHGTITNFVAIQHDVTVETELVQALKEKQAFIDTSPDIYLKIAPDLRIVHAGGACEAVSGWPAHDIIGRNAALFLQPERLVEAREKVKALLAQSQPSRFNADFTCRAGTRVLIEWSATCTEDSGLLLLVGRDITAKRTAEREVMRANAQIAAILSRITEGCLSLDRRWNCTYVNDKASEWLNRPAGVLAGKNFWDEVPEAIGSEFHDTYHRVMRTQQFGQCEAYYAAAGRWLEARVYPSGDGLTIFLLDISERKEHEVTLVYRAMHDALTGLPNRIAGLQMLNQLLGTGSSEGGIAALFIDLDHFKEINDTFGHAAGDEVLKQIGSRLSGFYCKNCYPARISGDEFVIIVSHCTDSVAKDLALRVLESIAVPMTVDGRDITLGASIGVSITHDGGITADDLINQADTAMYVSKSRGRHALTLFDAKMDQWNLRRRRLRQDMLQALHLGEFLLHYQPQISLRSDKVVGVEALVRWQHPEFGLLHPAAFLDIAEESPLIIELGEWVFNEACRQLKQWQDNGHTLQMSINVSARQLANRDMPRMMAEAIERYGIRAQGIKLEVTESMLAQDFDASAELLSELKQMGFQIALDDFGTGYSNLSYISRLPVTAIKIDRSFLTRLTTDVNALSLIKGIVALAKSLDLVVICEGVETTQQRAMLETTECDSIQGYVISSPLPAETFHSKFLKAM